MGTKGALCCGNSKRNHKDAILAVIYEKHNEIIKKNPQEEDDGLAVLGDSLEEEIHVIDFSARLCLIFPRNTYLRRNQLFLLCVNSLHD